MGQKFQTRTEFLDRKVILKHWSRTTDRSLEWIRFVQEKKLE